MRIMIADDFDDYWEKACVQEDDNNAYETAREIIEAVRKDGDKAVRHYASLYDKSSPQILEVPLDKIREAVQKLDKENPELANALRFSAENIKRFSLKQREQFKDFEFENVPGLFTGQRIIPVESTGIYVPGGLYPLISSALMGIIPAYCAGVKSVCFASPPGIDGQPDKNLLGAAGIAAQVCGQLQAEVLKAGCTEAGFRCFAIGGAQAIAALALGTETVPRCDVVAGPGNKYVAAAKRVLFGNAGIDFVAGPSDILVILDEKSSFDLAAIDMLAQAEHDPDARARALVPSKNAAEQLEKALEKHLENLPLETSQKIARQSLACGGLIVIYNDTAQAIKIANTIAPEHLELHISGAENWVPSLINFGSLFIGELSAEVLGDYSSGLNHTLPTSGSSRFTSSFSVRYFLKTLTTLRCDNRSENQSDKSSGYISALKAAQTIARAEGLEAHALSAKTRLNN